jgi:3-deoxy-D-manno-octulosonic-acid transferase
MSALLYLYRNVTALSAPALRLLLRRRLGRGKEEAGRVDEKTGVASLPRPPGRLLWCHGASVGESLSALPLIERLCAADPALTILVTTTTVTSARLMAERLPKGAVHQYAPLDHPGWVERFMTHWRPDAVLWLESELWPNLLRAIRSRDLPCLLVNGRMSDRSFRNWQRLPATARALLASFTGSLAQSRADAERFSQLGAKNATYIGNLKFGAPRLPVNEAAAKALSEAIGNRPVWLAASTHPGEEEQMIAAHKQLSASHPGLLTVIAPRHPNRGEEVSALLAAHDLPHQRRSTGALPAANEPVYLADTLGEMGTLFQTMPIVFMGGSFAPIGGHNPIEPALFGCAVLHGPHMENFRQVREELEAGGGLLAVNDAAGLASAVSSLLASPERLGQQGNAARAAAEAEAAVLDRVQAEVTAILPLQAEAGA